MTLDRSCGCWHDAAKAAEHYLISVYGVDLVKQLDPLKPRDFVTLITQFGRALGRRAEPIEKSAVRQALKAMDVDWPNITAAQRSAAIKAANTAIRRLGDRVPPKVDVLFRTEGPKMARRTKTSFRRTHKLEIRPTLDQADLRFGVTARKSQANFITDFYGGRANAFESSARSIVAGGLDQGLGRDEIAASLERSIGSTVLARTPAYWNVIAGAFMNRGRTFTQLNSLRQAAIKQWVFEAIVDEVTTEQCRFFDGKVFSVERTITRMEASEKLRDPLDLKNEEPWVQSGKNAQGKSILYVKNRQGLRTVLADVLSPGLGTANKIGEYRQRVTDRRIEEMGIPSPPLHGLCRSTVVPA